MQRIGARDEMVARSLNCRDHRLQSSDVVEEVKAIREVRGD